MSRKAFVSVEKRRVNSLFTTYILERGSLKSEKGVLWQLFHGEEAKNKEIKVSAEIPGVEPKDIDVSVEDGILTIKGEKKYEREEKEKGQYRMERSYGSFERTIELPAEVDESKAKAEFKKGVLRLTLPKRPGAPSRRKRISVT